MFLKINFDAAWDWASGEVGIGVAIKDHASVFFAGLSKAGGRAMSVEIAQLMAAREAITFVWEAGFIGG